MSKIVIKSQETLTNADLAVLQQIKKANVVGSGSTILSSSAVTISGCPSGISKGTAARVIANRMVEEQLASGQTLDSITWKAPMPTNEIWYTSTDGNIVTPLHTDVFDANIVSNTYSDGKGIIKFDRNVTKIGGYAFMSRTSLRSVTIPNSVTIIEETAFYYCTSLSSITIPNSVTTIQMNAFAACTSLSSITIPNSVTSIEQRIFADCTSLSSITIPNSVTFINNNAFYSCTSLSSITIPNSVTTIRFEAFKNCRNLSEVICNPTTPPTLGSDVFSNTSSSLQIKVPSGSVDAYKAATNWSSYASKIVSQ